MSRIAPDELERLYGLLREHDHLRRVRTEIERLHAVVFHAHGEVDEERLRTSAAQILIAEIVSRHHGKPEGIYYVLRSMEDAGQSWDSAVHTLATQIHSYYTTPLGIVMRQDFFGDQAVYLSPDAADWTDRQRGTSAIQLERQT